MNDVTASVFGCQPISNAVKDQARTNSGDSGHRVLRWLGSAHIADMAGGVMDVVIRCHSTTFTVISDV